MPVAYLSRFEADQTEFWNVSAPGLEDLIKPGDRMALNDVGAGYSSWSRIAKFGPDILKVDRSIVADLHASPAQRAIVAALLHFSRETSAKVLVEGVETREEVDALKELGVEFAQGWYFQRPGDLDEVLGRVSNKRWSA